MDKVKDDIKEKGLSADDVYDRATWRRMSSYIDPTLYKWEYDEGEEDCHPSRPRLQVGKELNVIVQSSALQALVHFYVPSI